MVSRDSRKTVVKLIRRIVVIVSCAALAPFLDDPRDNAAIRAGEDMAELYGSDLEIENLRSVIYRRWHFMLQEP